MLALHQCGPLNERHSIRRDQRTTFGPSFRPSIPSWRQSSLPRCRCAARPLATAWSLAAAGLAVASQDVALVPASGPPLICVNQAVEHVNNRDESHGARYRQPQGLARRRPPGPSRPPRTRGQAPDPRRPGTRNLGHRPAMPGRRPKPQVGVPAWATDRQDTKMRARLSACSYSAGIGHWNHQDNPPPPQHTHTHTTHRSWGTKSGRARAASRSTTSSARATSGPTIRPPGPARPVPARYSRLDLSKSFIRVVQPIRPSESRPSEPLWSRAVASGAAGRPGGRAGRPVTPRPHRVAPMPGVQIAPWHLGPAPLGAGWGGGGGGARRAGRRIRRASACGESCGGAFEAYGGGLPGAAATLPREALTGARAWFACGL